MDIDDPSTLPWLRYWDYMFKPSRNLFIIFNLSHSFSIEAVHINPIFKICLWCISTNFLIFGANDIIFWHLAGFFIHFLYNDVIRKMCWRQLNIGPRRTFLYFSGRSYKKSPVQIGFKIGFSFQKQLYIAFFWRLLN